MRVELTGVGGWRHELTGCLHVTLGALLSFHGLDPVEVLGANWEFSHVPGLLRREEYFLPGEHESLLSGLAPYHQVSSRWHEPADAESAWPEVREAVAAGRPVAVAADNFYLPFRPAFADVHTNHLVTVYGFDDEKGEALVADAVPPRFRGPLSLADLSAARGSANQVRHDRDMFFTDNPIGHRWLDIEVGVPRPAFDQEFIRGVTASNAKRFRRRGATGYVGLTGQQAFLAAIADRLAAGLGDAVDEAFVVAGPVLAMTALHARWLASAAARFSCPQLLEAARAVDRVAHHWTAVRIIAAAGRDDLDRAARSLSARAVALASDHERAISLIEDATADLA
ncbi:MAG TPA: BtrH N-terminal domain-containing protein [Streptosporangiaceae bacterium]|jgi:hypothetical protein|nr:BtrH N-terminal domain-containing protein [Streptosporangiaceae bacterium]